jgi:hypothetical protein
MIRLARMSALLLAVASIGASEPWMEDADWLALSPDEQRTFIIDRLDEDRADWESARAEGDAYVLAYLRCVERGGLDKEAVETVRVEMIRDSQSCELSGTFAVGHLSTAIDRACKPELDEAEADSRIRRLKPRPPARPECDKS